MASDGEWRAALTLWWAAWNQKPAGSLPDDDSALCRLADLGRDVKTWKTLREKALHGFMKCSDGRLYHTFLCRQALIAWEKRVKERERKANYRAKKQGQNADVPGHVPRDNNGTERRTNQGRDADVPADGNRRDVTGRDGNIKNPVLSESGDKTLLTGNYHVPKTPLPHNFGISDEVKKWAKTKGYEPDLPAYLEVFKLKAEANGYTKSSWDSAFKTSMLDDWGKVREKKKLGGGGKSALELIEEMEAKRASG